MLGTRDLNEIYFYFTGNEPPRLSNDRLYQLIFSTFLNAKKITHTVSIRTHSSIASLEKIYGSGAYGIVLKAVGKDGTTFAVKVAKVQARETFKKYTSGPLVVHQKCAELKMAPAVFAAFEIKVSQTDSFPVSGLFHITVMEPISGVLVDFGSKLVGNQTGLEKLTSAFECLLGKKYLAKLLHGDMHDGNIALLRDENTLGFIDFDLSMFVEPQITILDFVPIIGSLLKMPNRGDTAKFKPLAEWLINYYNKTYNLDIVRGKFGSLKGGGFAYRDKNIELCSYLLFYPLKQNSLETVFPRLTLPKIVV